MTQGGEIGAAGGRSYVGAGAERFSSNGGGAHHRWSPSRAAGRVMGFLDWVRKRRDRAAARAEGTLWIEASESPFGFLRRAM